jgi:hypothetical protein
VRPASTTITGPSCGKPPKPEELAAVELGAPPKPEELAVELAVVEH